MHAVSVMNLAVTLHYLCCQVKKISSIFRVLPNTLFLVEEIDNVAIFPNDSGHFKPSQLSNGTTYEVHGEDVDRPMEASALSQPSTPFGAYTSPVFPAPKQSLIPKSKSLRRVISLVSLSAIDPTKPGSSKASKFDYTIVTQVYVCLTPDQCNVGSVTDLVAKQVGFAVILLDCKCYPLPSSPVTCCVDFWKGSRKIFAASKSLYNQLNDDDVTEIPKPKKRKHGVRKPIRAFHCNSKFFKFPFYSGNFHSITQASILAFHSTALLPFYKHTHYARAQHYLQLRAFQRVRPTYCV